MEAVQERPTSPTGDEYQLNLRQLQEEALERLYVVTSIGGLILALLAQEFTVLDPLALLGVVLIFLPVPLHSLLSRHYLARVWVLAAIWAISIVATMTTVSFMPGACMLALPVALVTLFVDERAGVLTGLAASLFIAVAAQLRGELRVSPDWLVASASVWGGLLLVLLSVRPWQTTIRWSWQAYADAQQQLEVARARQAELNQAVMDLAEATVQTRRLNEMLAIARRAAEEAERAKAEFVANVSHELRTPLNMILGFAEMIVEAPRTYGTKLPAALLADVAAIQRNSQHLASLINDVLDISQVEAQRMTLTREWNSLADIVEAAVLAVQPLFESRGLYLKTELPDDLPQVFCDRTRIRQVLLNLLNNAARFTDQGGVTIAARSENQHVTVTVTDTGAGIAQEDLPKLFEPFRQLDGSVRRKQGGSGLGLNISRRFVELHGGRMGVESTLGKGSTFWFSLPVQSSEITLESAVRWLRPDWEPRRHSSLTPKPRIVPRVVVLEPESMLRQAAQRYLDGVEIVSAATPAEAQALLAAAPAQMLLVRGGTLAQTSAWVDQLHNAPYATPVVACTLPTPDLSKSLGVAGYLTKPITRTQIFEAIERLNRPVRSVLLTDDDPEALQLFGRILSSGPKRYRVLRASSGPEALELMRARRPDLLLLDLIMPGMDGWEVLAEKNRSAEIRDIPVLILSAQDPSGQPIVAPSLLATRSGGLSLPDLLRAGMAISEILSLTRPWPGAEPQGAPGA